MKSHNLLKIKNKEKMKLKKIVFAVALFSIVLSALPTYSQSKAKKKQIQITLNM